MVKKRRPNGPNKEKDHERAALKEDDLITARDRFRGALQDLLPRSDDDSNSGSEEDSWPRSKRSKRKAHSGKYNEEKQQQPFVMKMLERSVDLAQFNENTPLYVICRAWIANQPHQPYTLTVPPPIRPRSPAIKEEPMSPQREEDLVKDTYSMFAPSYFANGDVSIRIPKPVERVTRFPSMSESEADTPSREELLEDNRQHWLRVKKSWRDASHNNEQRYEKSLKILTAMFNKAQRMNE
ncbi:Lin-37 homolog (Hypothetical protein) [Nesidiocoris tenuis]|uniref:Protein lin-37 homolog n=1 Tax=Nesidiocoris tenuis TaxID=355587 RepID=A0ABN7B4I5_9HEMI|nr:Lin-37 homolog (Hypothetical protein) [Nesidiocoris tenuis]